MNKHTRPYIRLIAGVFLIALLSACTASPPEPTAVAVQPTSTSTPASPTTPPMQTPLPTETPTAVPTATSTATLEPTSTQTPLPTSTQTPTPTLTASPIQGGMLLPAASGDSVWMYFIQLDTGGSVGCGDSAIAVGTGVKRSGNIATDVKAGLAKLLATSGKYFGSLYNPLDASNIRVESVKFNRDNGLITVKMRGTYKPSGDDCDATRVKAQVWSTIRQFSDVKMTNIYLNDIPFGDRVSNDK